MDGEGSEVSKETIRIFLLCSLTAWLLSNMAFFCSIDTSNVNTFFNAMTASQYTCERFRRSIGDAGKFDAVFLNRESYTKPIHGEVKTWVANNIDRWKLEKPEWFKIDKIPEEMMPSKVGEGVVAAWKMLAEEIYASRSDKQEKNSKLVDRIFTEKEELVRSLMEECPRFNIILSHMLVLRFGVKVLEVDGKTTAKNWTENDCRRIGRAVATMLRERASGKDAMRAWKSQYKAVVVLMDHVDGLEGFMKTIFKVSRGGKEGGGKKGARKWRERDTIHIVTLDSNAWWKLTHFHFFVDSV